jgi:hypothetical protein
MFGKKKPVTSQTMEFHCVVCGIDCHDSDSLNRHMRWSHPEPVVTNTRKSDNHAEYDKIV